MRLLGSGLSQLSFGSMAIIRLICCFFDAMSVFIYPNNKAKPSVKGTLLI